MDALQYAETVLWSGAAPSANDATIRDLQAQLQAARNELTEVKKSLDEKVQQLYHTTSSQQQSVFEQSQLEHRVHDLVACTQNLEGKLAAKEQELEELRKAHAAQKKVLYDLQETIAERRATQAAEEDASRAAAQNVVEDELERLSFSLTALQARSQMELAAKDSELRALRQQLQDAIQQREDAVNDMEKFLNTRMQQQVELAKRESAARVSELEAEVVRLRTRLEDMERAEQSMDLPRELAALNNQKVQIQREFEAFRELTSHASRQNREEVARLLDENAGLRSKITSLTLEQINTRTAAARNSTAAAQSLPSLAKGGSFLSRVGFMPDFLIELDRRRQGLAPMGLIAVIVGLVVLLAVVRAAVSTHGSHPVLCFFSKLGIQIGAGCGDVLEEAKVQLEKIIEKPTRVHDVPKTATQATVAASTGRLLREILPVGWA